MKIQAEKRKVFGKRLGEFRAKGKLPAVLYGKNVQNTALFVDREEFIRVWREASESAIIKLFIGKESFDVIIYDIASSPVENVPVHVDFFAVEKGKSITAEVVLDFVGISPAVKEKGGDLIKVIHKVEVECLPKDLPHELKADISKLSEIGARLLIKDIELPDGVKILAKPDDVVALVEFHEEEIQEEEADKIEGEKGEKEKEHGFSEGRRV